MTMYMLALTGDEEKTAHRATFGKATLISISRRPGVATARGPADRPEAIGTPGAPSPGALAALFVRTLDFQAGAKVVLADFDSEELAAKVVAEIAALGRDVTCAGRAANVAVGAVGAHVRPMLAQA